MAILHLGGHLVNGDGWEYTKAFHADIVPTWNWNRYNFYYVQTDRTLGKNGIQVNTSSMSLPLRWSLELFPSVFSVNTDHMFSSCKDSVHCYSTRKKHMPTEPATSARGCMEEPKVIHRGLYF